jgi:heat shock protein Hsp20
MTQMTRRTPTRTLRTLQREVDDLFDQFFGRTDGGDRDTSPAWSPSTDLVETDEDVRLHLDVPGMSADDISINL